MSKKVLLTYFWMSLSVTIFTFVFFQKKEEQTLALFMQNFGITAMYCGILGMGNGLVNNYLSKRYSWIDQTRSRVISGIIGTILVNVCGVLAAQYILYIIVLKHDPAQFFKGGMAISNWIAINIALLISAVLHAKSFMEEWKKSARQQVVEQKIIARSADAKFESLKNQLDPHFLFNSLNVLDALIEENPRQAQKFTADMSKIYRYVLDEKDKALVTVSAELDFAKTYCQMLKTRFEDSVSFEFDVENGVQEVFVVPLSLQLLLENTIKHNFATASQPLRIRIYNKAHFLCIENTLQPRPKEHSRDGIGLSNIAQRYALLTTVPLTIDSSNEKFTVKIPMLTEKILPNQSEYAQRDMFAKAVNRVQELKKFYTAVIVFVLVNLAFAIFNIVQTPENIWFPWVTGFWGLGLIVKAIKLFALNGR